MIYITDTLRISKVDDNCLQLEEFKEATSKKTGKTSKQWRWIGYYGNVKEACAGTQTAFQPRWRHGETLA